MLKHLTEKVTAVASLTRGLFKKNTNYSYAVRISISLAILSEIIIIIISGFGIYGAAVVPDSGVGNKYSFKLVTFSGSYARKYKWVFFFLNTV